MQIEVFIHDAREEFNQINLLKPESCYIFNNTVTSLLIRPELVQKLSKKEIPCNPDEFYSYTRVSSGENDEILRI